MSGGNYESLRPSRVDEVWLKFNREQAEAVLFAIRKASSFGESEGWLLRSARHRFENLIESMGDGHGSREDEHQDA